MKLTTSILHSLTFHPPAPQTAALSPTSATALALERSTVACISSLRAHEASIEALGRSISAFLTSCWQSDAHLAQHLHLQDSTGQRVDSQQPRQGPGQQFDSPAHPADLELAGAREAAPPRKVLGGATANEEPQP